MTTQKIRAYKMFTVITEHRWQSEILDIASHLAVKVHKNFWINIRKYMSESWINTSYVQTTSTLNLYKNSMHIYRFHQAEARLLEKNGKIEHLPDQWHVLLTWHVPHSTMICIHVCKIWRKWTTRTGRKLQNTTKSPRPPKCVLLQRTGLLPQLTVNT